MNWSVRIVVIVFILLGLVWLNWDRLSDESMDLVMLEEGIDQVEGIPFTRNLELSSESQPEFQQESGKVGSEAYQGNLAKSSDLESVSPETPDFVLQPSPASLDNSDIQVRVVALEISPDAIGWFQPKEQLRKLTLLVTQAAEGKTLYQDRPFIFNLPEFAVEQRDERYFISTQNFDHYTAVVNVLVNMPVDILVAYYRSWYLLLEQAFGELGLPGSFDEKVDNLIERILAVEVLAPPIELKKPTSVTYKFLDPKLEGASQIDKWLWRMGPENTRLIQDLASRLKRALENSGKG
jgi:hypothetical protein